MADSLLFDGTDDAIDCDIGGTPTWGPGWCAAIFKATGSGDERIVSMNPATGAGGLYRSSAGDISTYVGGACTGPAVANDIWYLVVCTKASGSATPRFHVYNYNTTSWSHADGSGGLFENAAPGAEVHIGHEGLASYWTGNILIVGFGNSNPNDAAVEALDLETGLAAWEASDVVEAWRLDSMSAIQSFGTSGTADENARVGTSLDTGDVPAGWTDGEEEPPVPANEKLRIVRSNLRW